MTDKDGPVEIEDLDEVVGGLSATKWVDKSSPIMQGAVNPTRFRPNPAGDGTTEHF
ncbi:MAG: hypothetical protein AAF409_14495 [Pseudomonadota bacterium]